MDGQRSTLDRNHRQRDSDGSHLHPLPVQHLPVADHGVLSEKAFRRMLSLESKRAERSQTPFFLALLEVESPAPSERSGKVLNMVLTALASTTRETDVAGWYTENSVAGVMFTEIAIEDHSASLATITARVSETLRQRMSARHLSQVSISFHLFPEAQEESVAPAGSSHSMYSSAAVGNDVRRLG